jgi:hypothetical protein
LKIYSRYESISLTGDLSLISNFIKRNSHHSDDEIIHLFFERFFNPLIDRLKKDRIKEEYIKEKEYLKKEWNDENKILEMCPGKELIEKIQYWALKEYKIHISIRDLFHNLEPNEIDQDFHKLVDQVIQKCSRGSASYLRNYDPPKMSVKLYRNEIYFSPYYLTPVPEFNNDLLYFVGLLDKKKKMYWNKNIVVTTYDWRRGKIVKKTLIKERATIINMEYDQVADSLFATSQIKRRDELIDSIFIIEPRTDRIHKYELLYDSIEGKEGALSDLAVKAINKEHGIIYAASVYAQGGNKTLYKINYSIFGESIKFRYSQNAVGKYGPLSLISDSKKGKVYALNQEKHRDLGLIPVISIINTNSGNTVDKICISADSHVISPYQGHLLSIDNESNTLGVIIEEELYIIDISDKKILKIFKDKKYSSVASSSLTSKIYAIAEEEDLESSQPHYNSLHVIESNLQKQQITKFDPIIEASNIRCYNSIICINFRHKEIEYEYSFWLFEETSRRPKMIQTV